jgi:hypothetical protein
VVNNKSMKSILSERSTVHRRLQSRLGTRGRKFILQAINLPLPSTTHPNVEVNQ